jgi:integrase
MALQLRNVEPIPSRCGFRYPQPDALTAALNRLWADHKIKKHMTSHGLRALYVWVRRSQGADDSQIAFEIGHSSPLMIQRVYGSCPPHWRTGKAPNYSWRPTGKLAWSQLDLD